MTSVAEKLQKKSSRQPAVKQVRLKLVYIDFWSALKLSFLLAICLGIVTVVSAVLLWIVLNSTGIFIDLDGVLADILNDPEFSIAEDFSFARVLTFAGIIAAVNVVVFTALGAISAVRYILAARITGGLHVGFTNS